MSTCNQFLIAIFLHLFAVFLFKNLFAQSKYITVYYEYVLWKTSECAFVVVVALSLFFSCKGTCIFVQLLCF